MKGVTYAYLGTDDQASKFAKKGTATDVTLFNAKKGDLHLNLITPSRYPDKLSSLLVALDLADAVVFQPAALDRAFGESLVGAALFGRRQGFLRTSATVTADQVKPYLAQAGLANVTVTDEPDSTLRERLYELCDGASTGSTVVPVDHAFPVKGVGTVVLGLVRSGEVQAHQQLQAYPGEAKLEVRTIQVHDVDVKTAPTRSRVGLAIKGMEAADLPRGTVLAAAGSLKVIPANASQAVKLTLAPFTKWQPKAGAVLHVFHVLQDIVARVESIGPGPNEFTVKLDAPLARVPDQPSVVVDLDNPKQRFVGTLQWPG